MTAMSKKKWVKPNLKAIQLEQTKSGAGGTVENNPGQGPSKKFNDAANSPV